MLGKSKKIPFATVNATAEYPHDLQCYPKGTTYLSPLWKCLTTCMLIPHDHTKADAGLIGWQKAANLDPVPAETILRFVCSAMLYLVQL